MERIVLTEAGMRRVIELIERPPKPTEAMKKLMQTNKRKEKQKHGG